MANDKVTKARDYFSGIQASEVLKRVYSISREKSDKDNVQFGEVPHEALPYPFGAEVGFRMLGVMGSSMSTDSKGFMTDLLTDTTSRYSGISEELKAAGITMADVLAAELTALKMTSPEKYNSFSNQLSDSKVLSNFSHDMLYKRGQEIDQSNPTKYQSSRAAYSDLSDKETGMLGFLSNTDREDVQFDAAGVRAFQGGLNKQFDNDFRNKLVIGGVGKPLHLWTFPVEMSRGVAEIAGEFVYDPIRPAKALAKVGKAAIKAAGGAIADKVKSEVDEFKAGHEKRTEKVHRFTEGLNKSYPPLSTVLSNIGNRVTTLFDDMTTPDPASRGYDNTMWDLYDAGSDEDPPEPEQIDQFNARIVDYNAAYGESRVLDPNSVEGKVGGFFGPRAGAVVADYSDNIETFISRINGKLGQEEFTQALFEGNVVEEKEIVDSYLENKKMYTRVGDMWGNYAKRREKARRTYWDPNASIFDKLVATYDFHFQAFGAELIGAHGGNLIKLWRNSAHALLDAPLKGAADIVGVPEDITRNAGKWADFMLFNDELVKELIPDLLFGVVGKGALKMASTSGTYAKLFPNHANYLKHKKAIDLAKVSFTTTVDDNLKNLNDYHQLPTADPFVWVPEFANKHLLTKANGAVNALNQVIRHSNDVATTGRTVERLESLFGSAKKLAKSDPVLKKSIDDLAEGYRNQLKKVGKLREDIIPGINAFTKGRKRSKANTTEALDTELRSKIEDHRKMLSDLRSRTEDLDVDLEKRFGIERAIMGKDKSVVDDIAIDVFEHGEDELFTNLWGVHNSVAGAKRRERLIHERLTDPELTGKISAPTRELMQDDLMFSQAKRDIIDVEEAATRINKADKFIDDFSTKEKLEFYRSRLGSLRDQHGINLNPEDMNKLEGAFESLLKDKGSMRTKRVFNDLSELMEISPIDDDVLRELMLTKGYTPAEMTKQFMEIMSTYGKALGHWGRTVKGLKKIIADDPEAMKIFEANKHRIKVTTLEKALSKLVALEGVRRGAMILQVATAVRNMATQFGVIAVDMVDNALAGLFQSTASLRPEPFITSMKDNANIVKGVLNAMKPGSRKKLAAYLDNTPKALIHKTKLFSGTFMEGTQEFQIMRFFSAPNRLQENFFRHAAFESKLRSIQQAKGFKYGDPFDVNKVSIPDIEKAIEHSLRMTFAADPKTPAIRHGIKALVNLGLPTMVMPYPRFVIGNAIPFLYRHSPLGLLSMMGETTLKNFANPKILKKNSRIAAEATSGMLMFEMAVHMRNSENAGEQYDEFVDPKSGKTFEFKAFNPFATYLLFADFFSHPTKYTRGNFLAKMSESILGVGRIDGALLFTDALRGTESKDFLEKTVPKIAGQYLASFTTGFKTIKDIKSVWDPEENVAREHRTRMKWGWYRDKVSPMFDILVNPIVENIPGASKLLDKRQLTIQDGNLYRTDPTVDLVIPTEGMKVPFTDAVLTDLKVENIGGIVKQFSGMNSKFKPAVTAEFDRLGLGKPDFSIRVGLPQVEYEITKLASAILPAILLDTIESEEYRKAGELSASGTENTAAKTIMLKAVLDENKSVIKRQYLIDNPADNILLNIHEADRWLKRAVQRETNLDIWEVEKKMRENGLISRDAIRSEIGNEMPLADVYTSKLPQEKQDRIKAIRDGWRTANEELIFNLKSKSDIYNYFTAPGGTNSRNVN